jgi:hypothetical protein
MTHWQIATNLADIRQYGLFYPPLLAFALPLVIGIYGLRDGDRFERASAAFCVALFFPMFMSTAFIEVRAQMMLLVLLLPIALRGVHRVASEQSHAQT